MLTVCAVKGGIWLCGVADGLLFWQIAVLKSLTLHGHMLFSACLNSDVW